MAIVKFDYHDLKQLKKAKLLQKGEYRELVDAYDFLLSVRNELHFRNPRPSDVLLLEKQPEVALALGYKQEDIVKRVEVFMRDYYTHARNVFNLSNALEKHFLIPEHEGNGKGFFRYHRLDTEDQIQKVDAFVAKEGEMDYDEENIFERDPVQLVRVFRIAQKHELRLGARLVENPGIQNLLTPNYGKDDGLAGFPLDAPRSWACLPCPLPNARPGSPGTFYPGVRVPDLPGSARILPPLHGGFPHPGMHTAPRHRLHAR